MEKFEALSQKRQGLSVLIKQNAASTKAPLSKGAAHKLFKAIYAWGIQR